MNELFLKIINMSISASWLVLTVLILRFVLKKAPKWVNVLLWGIVAVRLFCPFSIESALSLIPSTETIPMNIEMNTTPVINSGINAINSVVNPIISQSNTPANGASVNPLQITMAIFANIWVLGVVALLIYTAVSYWRLCRKVDTAVLYRDNIFQSENVSSPFVFGIVKPRIYLPFKMNGQALEHVVAHEQAHIRRRDHWWKPIGFLLLMIHWFNPLMWLAYALLCRDIELACDEKVIKKLGNEQRADYTQALVACSVNRRMIAACPLAFGEIGVKERVKSVMNYKKPAFWITVIALIACFIVAVCFLTNPEKEADNLSWPTLEDTRDGYSMEQAATDGCVVIDGNMLLAGEEIWSNFVNETKNGKNAVVRVYQAYSDQDSNYYVKELRYDGVKYYLRFYDRTGDTNEEFLSEREYKYLVQSRYSSRYMNGDFWLLADSEDVNAKGYFSSMLSSVIRPENDIYNRCYLIYSVNQKLSTLSEDELITYLQTWGITIPEELDGVDVKGLVEDLEADPNKVFVLGWTTMSDFCEEVRYVVNSYYGITEMNEETFDIKLTWGVGGQSSYYSKTGTLVKTINATNPENYITTMHINNSEMSELYNMVLNMNIESYPDIYDPYNSPDAEIIIDGSKPSYELVLTVETDSFVKTIECSCVLFFGEGRGYNEEAQAFLDLCNRIYQIIVSSEEWESLPEYEVLYE